MTETTFKDQACRNLRWSLALLAGLYEGGMRQLVLSPGSRSTPLVLAAQRLPRLALTPIVDERSAAFFALGLARATHLPVGVLCTSGSAPAHWFPAVIEASEWGTPLILLSADRPPQLRGWGANQTVDQTRLFGPFVRAFHDPGPPSDAPSALKAMRALGLRAAAESQGRDRGPVHLNLPLPEPLVPDCDCQLESLLETDAASASASPRAGTALEAEVESLSNQRLGTDRLTRTLHGRGLICCGPGNEDRATPQALWQCAQALSLPVLVDPLSGLRFGPAPRHRIAHYDSLLRSPEAARHLRPDWVLRFGRSPVSKTLTTWLAGVPAVLVDPAERWCDPTHDAGIQIGARAEAALAWLRGAALIKPDPEWLAAWVGADRRVADLMQSHLAQTPWCEAQLVRTLVEQLPAGDGLLCANSLPIRQLDTWSGTRSAPLAIFGNRGASGIDGQTSTLAGLNVGGVPTWGLVGDLALCHDLSGLFLGKRLDRPLIVLNNGGGRIFDYLPQRGLAGLERLWRTPQPLTIELLAGAFGLGYRRIADGCGLAAILADARPAGLVEVVVDAGLSQQAHQAFWQSLAQADIV